MHESFKNDAISKADKQDSMLILNPGKPIISAPSTFIISSKSPGLLLVIVILSLAFLLSLKPFVCSVSSFI